MPDNFTRQWESTGTQWINRTVCQCVELTLIAAIHPDAPYFFYLLCLMSDNFTHQWGSAGTMGKATDEQNRVDG